MINLGRINLRYGTEMSSKYLKNNPPLEGMCGWDLMWMWSLFFSKKNHKKWGLGKKQKTGIEFQKTIPFIK